MIKRAKRCHKKLYDLRAELYAICKVFLGEEEARELFIDLDERFDYLADNIEELQNSLIRQECEIKELLR